MIEVALMTYVIISMSQMFKCINIEGCPDRKLKPGWLLYLLGRALVVYGNFDIFKSLNHSSVWIERENHFVYLLSDFCPLPVLLS